jgi:hypothetical protein
VQLHQVGWAFSQPMIQFNSGQQLELDFDDLTGNEYNSYTYTIVHCDADWQPSDMSPLDYLKGFDQDIVSDYSYSFNTLQKFTHYRIALPNSNMQMIVSGNFLLKVFSDNNPDSLLLTRRFMVYENKVRISGNARMPIGEEMNTGQEIIFDINTASYGNIPDPFHAFNPIMLQNGRWDNAIGNIQPQFVQDGMLQYEADEGNIFPGNNQFRSFDMTSLRYPTERIDAFLHNRNSEEIQLKDDIPRTTAPYYTFKDIHGQFLIQNKDADSSTISAEYVYVHFFLKSDSAYTGGNVYIFGQLSDWQCKNEFKLTYNDTNKGYVATLYLKQGYYEYLYGFLPNGSNATVDIAKIEGSHYETTNVYYILTYYRPPNAFYDKLIGMQAVNAPAH